MFSKPVRILLMLRIIMATFAYALTALAIRIGNMHVIMMDDLDNVIESGDAFEEPLGSGIGYYSATMELLSGTTVIVQAVATDRLGGVGTLKE